MPIIFSHVRYYKNVSCTSDFHYTYASCLITCKIMINLLVESIVRSCNRITFLVFMSMHAWCCEWVRTLFLFTNSVKYNIINVLEYFRCLHTYVVVVVVVVSVLLCGVEIPRINSWKGVYWKHRHPLIQINFCFSTVVNTYNVRQRFKVLAHSLINFVS